VLRARILSSAVALVGDVGYAQITVERVVRLSGVSRETFDKCFDDLDACLLAAFEDALRQIAAVVMPAYEGEREWPAKVRAAVTALLAILDDEPTMSMFVFVGALGAGPKVLACRMQALERLKLAFEHGIDQGVDGNGIDEMGKVAGSEIVGSSPLDGREISEFSPLSELREFSPLSAEGAVNGALGILHTRLLEGSPLARRPLSELAGPLTAMIVLPYLGRAAVAREVSAGRTSNSNGTGALHASSASNGAGHPASKVRPKPGARKRKRPRLTAKQRKLVAALKDGERTVRELVDATGLSDQTARYHLKVLEGRDKVVRTERHGKIAYELPSKRGAAAGRKLAAGSSSSNSAGSSNGAGASTSNGAAASNGHDRSAVTKAILRGLDPPISEREFKLIAAIDELNTQGSSPANRQIGNATKIYNPTQLSKLMEHLVQLWLVENTNAGRLEGKPYEWRLTTKGTELLRELGRKSKVEGLS
jgi:AcrR family transcriptional regulator/DNA-binding transcriptional ArsR family regulator